MPEEPKVTGWRDKLRELAGKFSDKKSELAASAAKGHELTPEQQAAFEAKVQELQNRSGNAVTSAGIAVTAPNPVGDAVLAPVAPGAMLAAQKLKEGIRNRVYMAPAAKWEQQTGLPAGYIPAPDGVEEAPKVSAEEVLKRNAKAAMDVLRAKRKVSTDLQIL